MEWKSKLETVGILAAILAAGATASWTVLSSQLDSKNERITELEKSNNLNYPDFLSKMNITADALSSHISTLEDIKILRKEASTFKKINAEYKVTISNQNRELKNTKKSFSEERKSYSNKITKLTTDIKLLKTEKTSFNLNSGTGTSLKKGKINVGYSSSRNNICEITVNNDNYSLPAGGFIQIQDCKVVLNKCPTFSSEEAKFELICDNKSF